MNSKNDGERQFSFKRSSLNPQSSEFSMKALITRFVYGCFVSGWIQ